MAYIVLIAVDHMYRNGTLAHAALVLTTKSGIPVIEKFQTWKNGHDDSPHHTACG
ncbi:hypothetical protein [Rhizobium sp. LjRoot254]|uniref:hypothetical protein n=1 Tax=Rhizobium sp. LjRoot254 TaxID=3342297 RepID=UPI003ECDAAC8